MHLKSRTKKWSKIKNYSWKYTFLLVIDSLLYSACVHSIGNIRLMYASCSHHWTPYCSLYAVSEHDCKRNYHILDRQIKKSVTRGIKDSIQAFIWYQLCQSMYDKYAEISTLHTIQNHSNYCVCFFFFFFFFFLLFLILSKYGLSPNVQIWTNGFLSQSLTFWVRS